MLTRIYFELRHFVRHWRKMTHDHWEFHKYWGTSKYAVHTDSLYEPVIQKPKRAARRSRYLPTHFSFQELNAARMELDKSWAAGMHPVLGKELGAMHTSPIPEWATIPESATK